MRKKRHVRKVETKRRRKRHKVKPEWVGENVRGMEAERDGWRERGRVRGRCLEAV